ncbi:hypothetical protein FisN_18Hh263 [Fistulifera solaris]|jgi:transmembrane 9 superfamily protein 2/4|uniref:Transmembrane 9 superfamily member n=1 Tax=Fistulifera solaris TaxID=1519565 RepID=A0A1Z5KIV8_FISSO|nr:hypothetical protein FisN_18Hh263 [Fistulifera solaris]|eukprot:GAX26147.1 hypothetical protein FisN_18Hh263 [Fistulifera solaris]
MNIFIRLLTFTALLSVSFAVEPKKLPSSTILKQAGLKENTIKKIETGKRLNRTERKEIKDAEKARYIELRNAGADEVSNTEESIALRNYKLKNKKRKGLIRKREATLADILFPGVAAQDYVIGEPIAVYTDVVESRKRPVPYDYYDLPGCSPPIEPEFRKKVRMRKNLGMRLQGRDLKVAPFDFRVKKNMGCTPMCSHVLDSKKMRWMRRLIAAQYRVQLELDQLPVLMRSKDYNYAVRGYPLGFIAPENFHGLRPGEYYLFNHLRFVVTYHEDPAEFTGVRITGFDVHPVSVKHQFAEGQVSEVTGGRQVPPLTTCNGLVDNDPAMYLELKTQGGGLRVVYSYEVEWIESELPWSDRWDVYLIGTPDDELHYFSIVNSLMIVLFLTGAISTIMIRTLKKDIATYSEMDALEDGMEETGWKLVHGDVFRPPQFNPMLLCVLVGNGGQIGAAFGLSMLAGVLKMLNPMQKGQTLTCLIILYVLCGSVSGYTSARLYKYMDGKRWKINIILTAVGLPGILVSIFIFLNIWLSFAGAATAVSIFTIIKLFLLWALVSTPLVFLGGFIGFKVDRIEVPCKVNQIARVVPLVPWHVQPHATFFMGGILPFGSVCIELAFIMSALWLHQIYYVLGFLLIVWLILVATCAQVSIVLTYLQLCAEDHRWWWNSFLQCSSAGLYLFLYSLYFLVSRLEMVGVLPVVIYLTYMGMISLCFALVCGSVGFLSAFWFTKTIYSAVKID